MLIYKVNLNLKDFDKGVITNMEENPSKQPKIRWIRLLKPNFKTKANKRNQTRWTRIFETNED